MFQISYVTFLFFLSLSFVSSAQPASSEHTSHFCNIGRGSNHMGRATKTDTAWRFERISCRVLGRLPWRRWEQRDGHLPQTPCLITPQSFPLNIPVSLFLSLRVGWNAKHHNHQRAGGAQRPGEVHQLQHPGAGLHPGWGWSSEQRPVYTNSRRLWVHIVVDLNTNREHCLTTSLVQVQGLV